ncbi:MAG: hypothetical protein EBY91_02770, partial [Burkholderiaceae bacterium]|nr:hypothetical protein [Burkholderiaceae bacterium]
PASALLEVLDPEQNHTFQDHYVEVDFDLSDVMFVATANSLNIPGPLLDRMEVIRLAGYTEDEKLSIAKNYLIPKQNKNNGLKDGELTIEESAIRNIIRYYTREAGVRALEREISKICRKTVKMLLLKKESAPIKVDADNLEKFLSVRMFDFGSAAKENQIGQVTGLAWTEVGGDLLTIEAALMPGKGTITRTGSIGDVMTAHRGGIKLVLIPEENVKDLIDIPDNVKNAIEIVPVRWIDKVLELALERKPEPLPDPSPEELAKKAAEASKQTSSPTSGDVIKH